MYYSTTEAKIKNMRLQKSPIVLCNTLFKVTKKATDIQGFWLDSNGKIHFDYIELVTYFAYDLYYFKMAVYRMLEAGELCVFYKDYNNHGVLAYKNGKKEVIKTRYEFIQNVKPSKDKIQGLLKKYGGLTVYKLAWNCYVVEVYPINYTT